MTDYAAKAAAYAGYFSRVSPDNLDELRGFCAPDVRFRDPFNDVRGQDQIVRIFAQMYGDVAEPAFEVIDHAVSGSRGYIRWILRFNHKKTGKPFSVDGMTEVHFDDMGRVAAHLDHWDVASQLYEHVPVLGGILRVIRRRLALRSN
ncbi:MAG: nuclear transport factor 2 family protein [Alphaproteobacteria bacterium]|nr:nuclear transport factor 2 family protein [Alphaproteobacteria bacterium]